MTNTTLPMDIARHRIKIDAPGAVAIWIPFVVFVALVIGLVAYFGEIRTSGWEKATQLPRWYAGAIGVYMTALYLPVYIAHGRTRREFLKQAPVAILVTTTVLAMLMAIGFAIESFAYRIADWPQTLSSTHLFESPTEFGLVFLEFWLAFVVWMVAGTFLGAGFYRNPGLGFLMLPVALLAVSLVEGSLGGNATVSALPPLLSLFDIIPQSGTVGRAVATAAGCSAVGWLITWLVARDLPVKTKAA
ncbi:MAG TPA: hypothetical protein VFV09_00935 [Actinomycetota bacterium]|nr:hypothetical protein [Actinomycetota bacterium]